LIIIDKHHGTPMESIAGRLEGVRERILLAESRFDRPAGSVELLAVSKTRSAAEIAEAFAAGQRLFGESYLQEALEKRRTLESLAIEWHFIGRVQSNKTRPIAENFDWVHSVDSGKQLQRLNDQRPPGLPPLNVCLQVKIDDEESKGGADLAAARSLLEGAASLPRVTVRGLMTLPAPSATFELQRLPFRRLRELRDRLATPGRRLETLSMGMSADIEAAIAEGATIVRVGTAIFGPRRPPSG